MIEGQDGAGRLRGRIDYLLNYIRGAKERRVKDCEATMLLKFGITPRTTQKYLGWLESYGELEFTNVARNVVRST